MPRIMTFAILILSCDSMSAQESPINLIQVAEISAKEKKFTYHQVVTRTVQENQTYTVDLGGKAEQRTRTVTKPVKVMEHKQISLAGVSAHEPSGKKLTDEQMWRKIKSGEVIVTVYHELPSTPYLNVLHPEALIIVLPGPKPEPPHAGPLPPAPNPRPGQ